MNVTNSLIKSQVGETKMRQNMDINFEQTLTISQYYLLKAYGIFVVHIKLKR